PQLGHSSVRRNRIACHKDVLPPEQLTRFLTWYAKKVGVVGAETTGGLPIRQHLAASRDNLAGLFSTSRGTSENHNSFLPFDLLRHTDAERPRYGTCKLPTGNTVS